MTAYLHDDNTDAARAFIPDNAQDARDIQALRRWILEGRSNLSIIHVNLADDTTEPGTFKIRKAPFIWGKE